MHAVSLFRVKPRRAAAIFESQTPPYVLQFSALDRADVSIAGGKGANLGEMTRAGFPVPPGFVVTTDAYREFMRRHSIDERVTAILRTLDADDMEALEATARQIGEFITSEPLPTEMEDIICDAYDELSAVAGTPIRVAVRSSATSEDSAKDSFAGMFESFLNVSGEEAVLRDVRRCWASGFSPRILSYRARRDLPHDAAIAVVVQRMADAEKSGVMFTADPRTGNRSRLVIEAAWGLGESVVHGSVTPDHVELDKRTMQEVEFVVSTKESLLEWDERTRTNRTVDLAGDPRADAPVLTDADRESLAEVADCAERLYGGPQDIEFAITEGKVWLTQCRPMTTGLTPQAPRTSVPTLVPLSITRDGPANGNGHSNGNAKGEGKGKGSGGGGTQPPASFGALKGLGASPGRAAGTARVLESPSDANQLQDGDVLITRMTTPDWVPIMRRAAAIVTDAGGMTSHAAIVARELGVPCVVGAKTATKDIPTGATVQVDGAAGTVAPFAGTDLPAPNRVAKQVAAQAVSAAPSAPVTATRIYVNLAEPERAAEVAAKDVDGVGLLRAEFMLLSALENTHPRAFIKEQGPEKFVERMRDQLVEFGRAFHPRPIIYRAMDFRSNEYRNLAGGAEFEPAEENPMIGYRGCFRYTQEPDLFNLELQALFEARAQADNIHLMIPFVRTGSELEACLKLVNASPLGADRKMKRWIMAEVPSVVYWLPAYAKMGIDGVSIGSNDLTQLVLGIDRDGERVAPLWDEEDPAVLGAIESIVTQCKALGLTCSICGQAPSVHPEYAARLVRWGIDSISVNPDAVDRTRRNVASAEMRIALEVARQR
jgi:pyruvate,water dikinase